MSRTWVHETSVASTKENFIKTYLEADEVDDICYASPDARDQSIMLLLRDTGIRVSELVSMKRGGLDLRSNQAFIRKSKIKQLRQCPSCPHKSGRQAVFCPQCGADLAQAKTVAGLTTTRRRIVSFSPEAAAALKKHLGGAVRSEWIFPSPRDSRNHLNVRSVRYLVQRLAEEVGLGGNILDHPEFETQHKVSPHRLRDAMAIGEFREDPSLEGLRVLAHKLGHSNPETTYAHYIKLISTEPTQSVRTNRGRKRPPVESLL